MYTIEEAGALLGLKPDSVYRYILRGKLYGTERTRHALITPEEIARFQRERRHEGGQPGRVWSEASRQKLRESRIGDKNPFKGRKHTPETLARMSAASARQPRGEDSHAWKGGRVTDKKGYIWVYVPTHPNAVNRYVLEHRLVMEQMLGRYLTPDEVVHHKNEIITDNRPENLQVMTNSAHSSYHRTLRPNLPRIRKARDKTR